MPSNQWLAFIASSILHTVLFIIVFFIFHSTSETIAKTRSLPLNTYLLISKTNPQSSAIIQTSAAEKKILKKILREKATAKNSTITRPILKKTPSHIETSTIKSLSTSDKNQLIILLHEAIQAKQVYPPDAIDMNRSGKVTVSFVLLKAGNILELKITQSSGTQSLDDAAINAVRNAAPFQNIRSYLNLAETFELDVVFEL